MGVLLHKQVTVCILMSMAVYAHFRLTLEMCVPMGIRISGNIFDARVAAVLAHCEHTCHNRDDILIGAETLDELFLEWEKSSRLMKPVDSH